MGCTENVFIASKTDLKRYIATAQITFNNIKNYHLWIARFQGRLRTLSLIILEKLMANELFQKV
jgi:hypothetical protein